MPFKLIAFSLSGVLVNFTNADNPWSLIRNIYQIPDFWKECREGKLSRIQAKEDEYKAWKEKGVRLDSLMINIRKNMKLMEGAKEIFSELNGRKIATAIVSDSPHLVVEDVARQLGARYFACNKILFNKDGVAYDTIPSHPTGGQRVSKLLALKDFANREGVRLSEAAAIGNDKEDVEIFRYVGRAIAFNPKDMETKKSAQVIVNSNTLEDVLQYLK